MNITTIVEEIINESSSATNVKRSTIARIAHEKYNLPWQQIGNELASDSRRVGRGLYDLSNYSPFTKGGKIQQVTPTPKQQPMPKTTETEMNLSTISSVRNQDTYIPERDASFIPWGNYYDVEKILKSGMFFPVYIAGMSGNGKTLFVEQACAKLKREYIRVQISPETDEDDLLGGWSLIDGETTFREGPVIKAMRNGSVLLLDELDRGTNKVMCIQSVLEGKPVMIKKTGEVVAPLEGFNVIATANTKGRGSDDGRYSAATIIDDAFLERFAITIDQPFPSLTVEQKIVNSHAEKFGVNEPEFMQTLVSWASTIRKTFEEEGCEDVISTRRICGIIKTFSIFNDRMKAIQLCISRFDEETRDAFLELYKMIETNPLPAVETEQENTQNLPWDNA